MSYLGDISRFIHILFGAVGLAAFWIPVFTRKGAVNHVRFGKVFLWSAYVVLGAAAIVLASRLIDLSARGVGPLDEPNVFAFIVFLGYLTYITFVTVRHGVGVLHHKRDPAALRSMFNIALAYGAIAASTGTIFYALYYSPPMTVLLFALSPIGFLVGFGNLKYMKARPLSKRQWMYEHLGSMFGAGIAFHTAFAVFGSARLFDIGLTGWVAVVPWVAPTAIGIPATILWVRHYRRKFGEIA